MDKRVVLLGPLLAVCFYLIFSPVWTPGLTPRLYDDARCLELILLAVVLAQLVFPPVADAVVSGWNLLGRLPRVFAIILLMGGVLGACTSGNPRFGLMEVALVLQLAILFLILSSIVRIETQRAETVIAIALCVGAATFVLKFWVTYVQYVVEGKIFPWLTPFLEFANVRFFSQYQAYSLLLVLSPMFLLELKRGWRVLLYIVAMNFWALQWIVSTRAVWVGLAFAILAIVVFAKEGKLAWLRMQLVAVAGGGIIYLVFNRVIAALPDATLVPDAVGSMVERGSESVSERIDLWRAALEFIASRPLLGVGPGQFGLQTYPMGAAHPHNFPLQMLAEYGVVAGAAGIALTIILLIMSIKVIRNGSTPGPDMTGKCIAGALIMGLTDAQFSGNLIMPHAQILFCVTAGWLVGRISARRPLLKSENSRSRHGSISLAFALLAILAGITTATIGTQYLSAVKDMRPGVQKGNPHFWNYGRFSAW